MNMTRRNFLKYSALTTLALSTAGLPRMSFAHSGSGTLLVSLFLSGGPDYRYIFVPPYNATANTFGNTFWTARARAHEVAPDDVSGLNAKWNQYIQLSGDGQTFGMHPLCGWLKKQYDEGNVAIINNVFGSRDRNHHHSSIIMETGNMNAGKSDTNLPGWGGRLAKTCDAQVASLTTAVRQFCYGPGQGKSAYDTSIIINAGDTRNFGLYEYETDLTSNNWKWNTRGYMSRALQSYYAAKRQEINPDSPYFQLFENEKSMRHYMQGISDRLTQFPVPAVLGNLYEESPNTRLNNYNFGRQMRNIYDTLACEDIMNTNILSTEYDGWDTHRHTRNSLEPKMSDIFGLGGGLDALYTALEQNQPGKAERIVFLVYGEFGRQLAVNGNSGTDHGVGNTVLVIGTDVNGGVYGDMFPESEIPRFSDPGANIAGRTSICQIQGQICEKIKPGSGDMVIPTWYNTALESGVNLSSLFA